MEALLPATYIRMPDVDGLTATREICTDAGLASTRILILTTYETDEYVAHALRAGASGFIGKGIGAADLLDAVRTVAAGETLLSPAATRSLVARLLATPSSDLSAQLPTSSPRANARWSRLACPTRRSPTRCP